MWGKVEEKIMHIFSYKIEGRKKMDEIYSEKKEYDRDVIRGDLSFFYPLFSICSKRHSL